MDLNQVCDIRQRIAAGENIPEETLMEVYRFLRGDRMSAVQTGSGGKKGKPQNIPSATEFLDDLLG